MTDPVRLPLSRLLAFSAPALPTAALTVPLYVFLPAFYADELGLGFGLVGAVLLAARLWDVAIDPVIGILSDRWVTRFGRRRPWLVAATPLALIAVLSLFVPRPGIGAWELAGWTMLLYLAWSMLVLPYTAWAAELSPDYGERTRITAFREVFTVIGTLAASGLPVLLSGSGETLRALAWALCLALPLTVALAVGTVREPVSANRETPSWREAARAISRNGPFRRLIAAYLLNGVANGLPATLFILFVTHRLGLPDKAGPLLFVYFLAGVLSVPLWLAVSARIGKHRAWCFAMLWCCAAFLCVLALGPGDFWGFLAICVATGASLGADLALPGAMQADVVDIDTARSGTRRTGVYFALWAMATKLTLALAVGIAFPILDLAGFQGGQGTTTPTAAWTLTALYCAVPVICKLTAVRIMWRYPIDASRHARLRRRIEARLQKDGI